MKSSNSLKIRRLSFSAILIVIGWLLPLITGQIPQIGVMFLPMHLPVLIAGIILGPSYGFVVGLILPISRFFIFGAPPIYPTGFAMTFELATYGFVSGMAFKIIKCNSLLLRAILSLPISMIAGRIVWGVVQSILGMFGPAAFTLNAFISGAFLMAWPGILIQFLLIPPIVKAFGHIGAFPPHEN